MVIVFERDRRNKHKIKKYLRRLNIVNAVMVNIEDALYELETGETNIFQELDFLKGPIIFYGCCTKQNAKNLTPSRVFSRKDACWVENIYLKNFKALYYCLYCNSEYFFKYREGILS